MARHNHIEPETLSERVHALLDAAETEAPNHRESLAILEILKAKKSPLYNTLQARVVSLVEEIDPLLAHIPDGSIVVTPREVRALVARSAIAGATLVVNSLGQARINHEHGFQLITELFEAPSNGEEIA